ncbi:FeoB-associated Cys-rich membrane protein [Crassaminicella thermophila]|uniref:FeoB-associated Cys-rich membrane protein n=1 Tax=Crassaminicella thermophila TaxID=2599308 RepID=A0A5C0SI24_CRATE|nr:FeoB-associated Cys-rich membrane protein [Crassaminicella thermophila]QEK13327.1 FeoB-associated Cys-rich membrane protein [Crassaminicella thermophila]
MGNFVTWIIGIPLISFGIYLLVRSFKKEIRGNCYGCSGCGENSCSFKK